ncbi:M23 family metallopeptidase [Pseudomonas sp. SORT22]|uniref:M23 family metallopeptidase n=1 Tax=Pseudomonas sp. SORT22 TaxID=2813842 RepID=UPI00201B8ED3|nr:M23 family metallopeptidase [Pseudomonas sp. SORT22]
MSTSFSYLRTLKMMPLKTFALIMLLAASASPATSFALTCVEEGTHSAVISESLGTALAVPADAPDGTIIWESSLYSINVKCADDYNYGAETIYFHMNPASVSIGDGIRAGIRYNKTAITSSSGKVSTGFSSHTGCNWVNCTGWDNAKFTLTFSIFIEKYGATPSSGQAGSRPDYRVFQLDGTGGQNIKPNSNLNYVVTGINNIRFIPCSPELTITPSTVNFRRALSGTATVGNVASSANFSLGLSRACDTPYTVNARFASTPGGGSVINNLLVPANNSSVGISLARVDNNEKIPFDTWFKLADLTGRELSKNDFKADLIWREPAKPGVFEASVIVDLFYK